MLRLRDGSEGSGAAADRPIDALLIDMDGTLVNSNAAVERTWSNWALANGVDPAEVIAVCHGATAEATITRFRPDIDDDSLEAMSRELMETETADVEGIVPMPGAPELVAWLDSLGVPWAVVTNANGPLCRARLASAGVAATVLATVEEVPVGKPDPALYVLGAERLGADIARCLVVEDSGAGVAAGMSAGALVAALNRDDGHVRIDDLYDLRRLLEAESSA